MGHWAARIGASFGLARLQAAKDLGDIIFESAEYAARQRSDKEYVTDLYWTYLQRPPDVMGLEFWVERIALQGRDGVREGFELSNEFAAQVGGVCSPGEPRGEVMWVMQDHQGSTRAMLNSAGQVVGRHDPLAFGDTAGEGNEVGPQAPEDETTGLHGWWNTVRHLYAGLERDAATGLEHATFRKYEPWAGRWTSPDPYLGSMNPADPQSLNRYTYVQNDPVNFLDPSGLLKVEACSRSWWTGGDGERHNSSWQCVTIYDDGGGGGFGGGGGGGGGASQNPGGQFPGNHGLEIGLVKLEVTDLLKNPDCAAVLGGLQNAQKLLNRAQVHYANTANQAYKGSGGRYPTVARDARAIALNPNSHTLAFSEAGQKGLVATNIYVNERFFTDVGPSQQDTVFIHELNRLNGFRGDDKTDYANITKNCGTANPYGLRQ